MSIHLLNLYRLKRTGAIITFNDITELKKIQQELDNSNQLLGMKIDSAEMGIWTIDTETLEFTPAGAVCRGGSERKCYS
jgi:PAS domain-containing protein